MLCFCNNSDTEYDLRTREIEEQLKRARAEAESKLRLLLLGTGDSGKSTFLKQMKVLHKNGFSTREIEQTKIILEDNALTYMQNFLLCEAIKFPKNLKKQINFVVNSEKLDKEVATKIEEIWQNSAVKEFFADRHKYDIQHLIPSSAPYYWENVQRFADTSWTPTQNDILRANLRTTGINEITFEKDGVDFTIIDVGGQRSERRKWLHCFDDITAVIYLAALDEYDMKLEEDGETNRLEESLRLFCDISGSKFFLKTSWILFLNKCDLFEEKIKRVPLMDFVNTQKLKINTEDAKDYDKACDYMKQLFSEKFQGVSLYQFITCALDTQNCNRVFSSVRDTIMANALTDVKDMF